MSDFNIYIKGKGTHINVCGGFASFFFAYLAIGFPCLSLFSLPCLGSLPAGTV